MTSSRRRRSVGSVFRIPTSTEMKVLSFAAVGFHGREWCARVASRVLLLALLAAGVSAQPAVYQDLFPELADKIAAAVTPSDAVIVVAANGDSSAFIPLVPLLTTRGVNIVVGNRATTTVTVSCGESLRDRVCAADIR